MSEFKEIYMNDALRNNSHSQSVSTSLDHDNANVNVSYIQVSAVSTRFLKNYSLFT